MQGDAFAPSDLSNNALGALPAETGNLVNLEYLCAGSNLLVLGWLKSRLERGDPWLHVMHAGARPVGCLARRNVPSNQLNGLPSSVGNLKGLVFLWV